MKKLTSEQREGILDFARNSLDPKITCPITGYEGNSHLRYGDLYAFLNANTAEEEGKERDITNNVNYFFTRLWADEEIATDTYALLKVAWKEYQREDEDG